MMYAPVTGEALLPRQLLYTEQSTDVPAVP